MPLFRRSQKLGTPPRSNEVIWGVARREGFADADDPEQHSGVTQHAFRLGQDNRAVCGYEPPRRRAAIGQVLPQLAVAGPANPRCPRCEALLTGQPAGDPADPLARLPGTALTQTTKRRR